MYKYADFTDWLASPEGRVQTLSAFAEIVKESGRGKKGQFVESIPFRATCDGWKRLAILDYLEENGFLHRTPGGMRQLDVYRVIS